jgi:hypothetical protein
LVEPAYASFFFFFKRILDRKRTSLFHYSSQKASRYPSQVAKPRPGLSTVMCWLIISSLGKLKADHPNQQEVGSSNRIKARLAKKKEGGRRSKNSTFFQPVNDVYLNVEAALLRILIIRVVTMAIAEHHGVVYFYIVSIIHRVESVVLLCYGSFYLA